MPGSMPTRVTCELDRVAAIQAVFADAMQRGVKP
jgi:hypothetical protein